MRFGIPLALIGLAAIAAPIVIHLLRQRDVPTRVLPTIALLSRAQAESRRRYRLRDRGLLLLRVLAIVAVVFAAAAPSISRSVAFDDARVSTLVILLDDSMSMGVAFDDAVERAQDAIDSLPASSEVAVILAGAPARVLIPRTDDLQSAEASVEGLSVTARGTDLAGAARLADRALAGGRHTRRLLVLSDFRASAFPDDVSWPIETATAFELFRDTRPNAAITHATSASDPTTPDQVSVQVRVRGPAGTYPVEVVAPDDSILARGEAQVSDSTRGDITLHVPEGPMTATVHLDFDDAIVADNTRGVLLEPSAAVRVLLVNGDPRPGRDDEALYLTRALNALSGTPAIGSRLQTRVVDTDSLDPSSLRGVNLVVLANVRHVSRAGGVALRNHVEGGGALWLVGGDKVDPIRWRASLGDVLPVTLGLARRGERSLEPISPELVSLGLTARSNSALDIVPDANAELLARWSDGTAALVRRERVVVYGGPMDADGTDLPLQSVFVAFVGHLIALTSDAPTIPSEVLPPGSVVSLGEGRLRVETPSGDYESVQGSFSRTDDVGVYRVVGESNELAGAFVIAPPEDESDLSLGQVPRAVGAATERAPVRSNLPVDPWVFALFALFVFAEGWLRERRGAVA